MDQSKEYGIKYKVAKLGNDKYLLFPMDIVEGLCIGENFNSKKPLKIADTKEVLETERYVVDDIEPKEAIKFMYGYEGPEDDFLKNYYFDDVKQTLLFIDASNEILQRRRINLDLMTLDASTETYEMYENEPAVILNEKALKELMNVDDQEELQLLLKRYSTLIHNFYQERREKGITSIYLKDGKLSSIVSNKDYDYSEDDYDSDENVSIEDYPEDDMDLDESSEEEDTTIKDISYNGLRDYLLERILGHDEEIKKIAKTLYYNRTAAPGERIKSILIVGPTGTGKTETFKAAAEYLNIPFAEYNASNLVPQGIVGTSIEDLLHQLVDLSKGKVKKAERGILFLDEFDKLNESKLDVKDSIKNILLTFTGGGTFKVELGNNSGSFTFNTIRLNKAFAGVFGEITKADKKMGFGDIKEARSEKTLRELLIDKKYFTLEELSRINKVLEYKDLDFETKRKILLESKLSLFLENKRRYKRQFGIDLIATEEYVNEIFDSMKKSEYGMRTVNNRVDDSLDEAEIALVENENRKFKKLVLTRDTVHDPSKFDLK